MGQDGCTWIYGAAHLLQRYKVTASVKSWSLCPCSTKGLIPDLSWDPWSLRVCEKKIWKMGGKMESWSSYQIKHRSSSGSLGKPQMSSDKLLLFPDYGAIKSCLWLVSDLSPDLLGLRVLGLRVAGCLNNIELCKFGSEEASGSLRLGKMWVGAKLDQLQSQKISNVFAIYTDHNRSKQTQTDCPGLWIRTPEALNREL